MNVQVGADVASEAGDLVLRATTRRMAFEGYQAAYATSFFRKPQSEDDEDDQEDSQASLLASGFPDLKVDSLPSGLPSRWSCCLVSERQLQYLMHPDLLLVVEVNLNAARH